MEDDAIWGLIGNAADPFTTVCEKVRKCSLVKKKLTTNFKRINLTLLSDVKVRSCFMYTFFHVVTSMKKRYTDFMFSHSILLESGRFN